MVEPHRPGRPVLRIVLGLLLGPVLPVIALLAMRVAGLVAAVRAVAR